jgi:low temperature requirement protein LtrA
VTIVAQPETPSEIERRTSYVELFFDLVFVFAITQVTTLLLEDTSSGGFARSAIVLFLVWWAWGAYAWLTNAIDIRSLGVRLVFLASTAGSFLIALAVPRAYEDQGLWFAAPYLAVRTLHVGLYIWGLRADPDHQAAVRKLAPWFLLAPMVVLAGGFAGESARPWLWAAAIAIDVTGALRMSTAGFRVSPAHFAERYALFVIIALGESVVAIGAGATELERDVTFAVAIGVAFAGTAALWWAYFDFAALAMDRTMHRTPPEKRGPVARDVFSLFHYPIVLGIIFYAVAAKKTLAEPLQPLSDGGRAALGIGVAVFLLGFALGRFRAIRRIAWERVAGAAGAAVVVLVLRDADSLIVLGVTIAVLTFATLVESARLREFRADLKAAAG